VFCVLEAGLLVSLRTVSGLAHAHAAQSASDMSAATLRAACSETVAAVDNLWPGIDLLSVGRVVPIPTLQAWGQVPPLVGVVRETCPSVATYAGIVPAPEESIQEGSIADTLANVRRQHTELTAANAQLGRASGDLARVDANALANDARLSRVARILGLVREQQEDISDTLSAITPDRMEVLLGGDAPRSVVLEVVGDGPPAQAYATLDQGHVTAFDIGAPAAAPVAVVSLNQASLKDLRGLLSHAQIAPGASDAEAARALLVEFTRRPFVDEQNVMGVIKQAADEHNAWLWFDDASLQAVVARRGWVRQ
jgi:hypothetical protein